MLEYGKLKEFPTFQHDKQITIVFLLLLKKCKAISVLKESVNSLQDYSLKV